MPIRILPPEVASKIAAGEVVERPASVVKELVENSLDAGATRIGIEVFGGGLRLIRVVDNGAGIPEGEVGLAFQRHATSKIFSAGDLERIASLGFRGEALYSIAAVADVDILTRSRDDSVGTSLSIREGKPAKKEPRGCPQGTVVAVRHLFRRVPARLKFLKSPQAEGGRIAHLVSQYSLAYPEVKFALTMEGRSALISPGNGSLKDALLKVYGSDVAQRLLEVQAGEGQGGVSGFISPPDLSRASRSYMTFFINRRWVQSRLLSYAVEEAYHGLLMTGRHPVAILNIRLALDEVDVNVHPSKTEIRFRNEREVFSMVQRTARETLLSLSSVPTLKTAPQPVVPHVQPPGPAPAFPATGPVPMGGERLPRETKPAFKTTLPVLRVLGQVSKSYIVSEGPDGVYLIDQHCAHERVLFEKLKKERLSKGVEVQGLLDLVSVELAAAQEEVMRTQQELLSEYGFIIEPFGDRTYLVRGLPATLRRGNPAQALLDVLDSAREDAANLDWVDRLACSIACHSAVRAGLSLTQEEMEELVRLLEQTDSPSTCPHGRPTMIHLSSSELEKEFGRR